VIPWTTSLVLLSTKIDISNELLTGVSFVDADQIPIRIGDDDHPVDSSFKNIFVKGTRTLHVCDRIAGKGDFDNFHNLEAGLTDLGRCDYHPRRISKVRRCLNRQFRFF